MIFQRSGRSLPRPSPRGYAPVAPISLDIQSSGGEFYFAGKDGGLMFPINQKMDESEYVEVVETEVFDYETFPLGCFSFS